MFAWVYHPCRLDRSTIFFIGCLAGLAGGRSCHGLFLLSSSPLNSRRLVSNARATTWLQPSFISDGCRIQLRSSLLLHIRKMNGIWTEGPCKKSSEDFFFFCIFFPSAFISKVCSHHEHLLCRPKTAILPSIHLLHLLELLSQGNCRVTPGRRHIERRTNRQFRFSNLAAGCSANHCAATNISKDFDCATVVEEKASLVIRPRRERERERMLGETTEDGREKRWKIGREKAVKGGQREKEKHH